MQLDLIISDERQPNGKYIREAVRHFRDIRGELVIDLEMIMGIARGSPEGDGYD